MKPVNICSLRKQEFSHGRSILPSVNYFFGGGSKEGLVNYTLKSKEITQATSRSFNADQFSVPFIFKNPKGVGEGWVLTQSFLLLTTGSHLNIFLPPLIPILSFFQFKMSPLFNLMKLMVRQGKLMTVDCFKLKTRVCWEPPWQLSASLGIA